MEDGEEEEDVADLRPFSVAKAKEEIWLLVECLHHCHLCPVLSFEPCVPVVLVCVEVQAVESRTAPGVGCRKPHITWKGRSCRRWSRWKISWTSTRWKGGRGSGGRRCCWRDPTPPPPALAPQEESLWALERPSVENRIVEIASCWEISRLGFGSILPCLLARVTQAYLALGFI